MIAFQLQIHQTILCFVMLCLGIQKAHFCFARGLPISFCQQGIRERLLNWGKKKGLSICFLWSAYVLDVPVGVTSLVLLNPAEAVSSWKSSGIQLSVIPSLSDHLSATPVPSWDSRTSWPSLPIPITENGLGSSTITPLLCDPRHISNSQPEHPPQRLNFRSEEPPFLACF